VLLRYVADQAEKQKNKAKGGDEDEDKDAKYKRLWYAPWKKVRMGGGAKKVSPSPNDCLLNRQVPPEMLETDRTKGLTASEAEERRSTFGYNELERSAMPARPEWPE
jgi:H+-transporting ATPase